MDTIEDYTFYSEEELWTALSEAFEANREAEADLIWLELNDR